VQPKDRTAGISYYDVRNLAGQVERDLGGHIAIHLYVPRRSTDSRAFDVRVAFTRAGGGPSAPVYERGISGTWPSRDASTLAGLMFRLVYDLFYKLDQEREEAERLTQGRLGL